MKNIKRTLVIIASLLLMFCLGFLQAPAGMTQDGLRVLGVFAGAMLLWLFIGIDWTSLLVILGLICVPSLSMNKILSSSFGNNTFAFLLFSFIVAGALTKTTLIKRIAVGFVTNKWAQKGPWQLTFLFFTAVIIIGCFISPSVLFIVMLPILEEMCELLNVKKGDRFGTMLIIGLVCCCGIASGMTPIGHAYGPLAMGAYQTATGNTISYGHYMAFAIPVGILSYIGMFFAFRFLMKPDTSMIQDINLDSLKMEGNVSRKEKMILGIFALVVLLWVAPSFIQKSLPAVYEFINSKTIAFPPLVGIVLMSILTDEGEPLLNFNKIMKESVAWPALIMCAGTLALGSAMTAEGVELNTYLAGAMSPVTSGLAPLALVILFTFWAAVQTNLSSNIVTITVVTSIAIPVCLSMGASVSTAAVCSIIGMMGGYAFAAPPAMPSVAISIGSGWTDSTSILKYGSLVMLIAVIVTVLVGYPIAAGLMG